MWGWHWFCVAVIQKFRGGGRLITYLESNVALYHTSSLIMKRSIYLQLNDISHNMCCEALTNIEWLQQIEHFFHRKPVVNVCLNVGCQLTSVQCCKDGKLYKRDFDWYFAYGFVDLGYGLALAEVNISIDKLFMSHTTLANTNDFLQYLC